MRKLFLHLIAAALFALAAGMSHGQAEPRQAACNRLARWSARYRSGAIDILLAEQYRRYAYSRTSLLAPSTHSGQGRVAAVVDWHRRYARGEIDARALARFLAGRDGGRKVNALASYAELLVVLHTVVPHAVAPHAGVTAAAAPEVEAQTAELLLALAAHAFGGSLAAEADRWGVYRRRAPILVRREATRHLMVLAARSSAARRRLLAVVRGEAPIETAVLDAREIAIRCMPACGPDDVDTYPTSRVLAEVLTRPGDLWVQLAAAHLLGKLSSPFHASLVARSLRTTTARVSTGSGSPGAVVARALVAAARAELARAHADKRLDAPWKDVSGGLHALVEVLVAMVRDRQLPLRLRRGALTALEAAPHWGVVRALAIASAEDDSGELAAEVLTTLRRMTRFQGGDAAAWRRWHARHHAGKDGAIAAPTYAEDPGQGHFYDIPLVGERILFVIDVSGSMADPLERARGRQSARFSKIGRTRAELIAAIERLDDRRRFDVLTFADAPNRMFGELVIATKKHRTDAIKRARSFGGSGWTDLGTAVLAALGRDRLGEAPPVAHPRRTKSRSTEAETELPDQIILLSDGMPTKGPLYVPGDFIDEASRLNRALRIRIDAVALGDESDPFFLERLAQENGGVLRVYPRETAEAFERLKAADIK